MKIRTKIILGFSIPILMFGVFGLWLHFAMASASEQLRHAKEESVVFALIAKGMRTHVAQVQQYLTDISATRGLDGLDDGLKDAETHYNKFIDDLVKFEQMFTTEGDHVGLESCKQVRIKSDEFYAIGVKMAHAYIDKGTAAGNKLMPDFDKKSLELQNILSPFIKTQLDELDTAVEVAGSNATKTRIAGLIFGLLATIVSVLVARATLFALKLYLAKRNQAESALRKARHELKEKNLKLCDEKELLEDVVTRMRSASPFDERKVQHIQSSLEKSAGDIILSAYRPDGSQHVLVGDFSGHGLPAAIGAPLVSYSFYRLTADGYDMRHILEEINRILFRQLPTQIYMAAAALEFSSDRKLATVWNCGMPPVLCLSKVRGINRIDSSELPLGISEIIATFESEVHMTIESDAHIYMYSDGITEAMSAEQEFYGQARLEASVSRIYEEQLPVEVIWKELKKFCSKNGLSDDALVVKVWP